MACKIATLILETVFRYGYYLHRYESTSMRIGHIFLVLMFIAIFSGVLCRAGEVTVPADTNIIVGFRYGDKDVPGPFRGVWKQLYYSPGTHGSVKAFKYSWKADAEKPGVVNITWIIEDAGVKISQGLKVDTANWSNGWYNATERKEIVTRKSLLHYDRVPVFDLNGILPDGLGIEKHVIGKRDGEDVELVIYRSKDVETLKKYFPMTEYESWNLGNRGAFEYANPKCNWYSPELGDSKSRE